VVMRRRFKPYQRRFVRTKRNGAWTGTVVLNATLTGGTANSWYLWDDLTSQRLNLGGKGRHERTLIWMFPWGPPGGATLYGLGWHLSVFQTDASNNVPTASIVSPWAYELMEKSPLDVGYRQIVAAGSSGVVDSKLLTIERDIKVKRKLDDTDALLFTVSQGGILNQGLNSSVYFGFIARTYVSW